MKHESVEAQMQAAPSTLTPEEAALEAQYMAEYEEGYQKYAALAAAYDAVIALEDDPVRKEQLLTICGFMHEDNK